MRCQINLTSLKIIRNTGLMILMLIPIVLVTALGETEARVKGIEAGAEDFISKPPNRVELMARINSLLKVNRLNKKLISVETVLISMANALKPRMCIPRGKTMKILRREAEEGKLDKGIVEHLLQLLNPI